MTTYADPIPMRRTAHRVTLRVHGNDTALSLAPGDEFAVSVDAYGHLNLKVNERARYSRDVMGWEAGFGIDWSSITIEPAEVPAASCEP